MDIFSVSWWRQLIHGKNNALRIIIGCILAAVIIVPLFIGIGSMYSGPNPQGDINDVIAKVNGEPVTRVEYLKNVRGSGGSGMNHAFALGTAMKTLVVNKVLLQTAKQKNVQAGDAEVDRMIAQERTAQLGDKATDEQWTDYVRQAHGGMTPGAYRKALLSEPSAVYNALTTDYSNRESLTPTEVKNLASDIKVRVLMVSYGSSPFAPKNAKTLSEDEAKKKAEQLLSQAKAGAKLDELVKKNSDDFNKMNGGLVGPFPEYRSTQPGSPPMLEAQYGKEFAEAVNKTETGQITPIVKFSGFQGMIKGYGFAKIEERKENKPKDFDAKKEEQELKKSRAQKKLNEELEALIKSAKVEFTPQGDEQKAYYDYIELQQKQARLTNPGMGGGAEQPPTKQEVDALEKQVDTQFDALQKKKADDATLALLVSQSLKKKLATATSTEKTAVQDRLITLYETSLGSVEDRQMRFDLGDLYRDKNKPEDAARMYKKIADLMDISPASDLAALQEEQRVRNILVAKFRGVKKEEEAKAELAKSQALSPKIAAEQKKQQELQKQQQKQPGGLNPIPSGRR